MHPNIDAEPDGWPGVFSSLPKQLVFDTIYNPMKTKLLRSAEAAGAKTVGGVEMFVRQAAVQFQAWTGVGSADAGDAKSGRGETGRRSAMTGRHEHHPIHAEFIGQLPVTWREECLHQRHLDRAALRQGVEHAIRLGFILHRHGQRKAGRLLTRRATIRTPSPACRRFPVRNTQHDPPEAWDGMDRRPPPACPENASAFPLSRPALSGRTGPLPHIAR